MNEVEKIWEKQTAWRELLRLDGWIVDAGDLPGSARPLLRVRRVDDGKQRVVFTPAEVEKVIKEWYA